MLSKTAKSLRKKFQDRGCHKHKGSELGAIMKGRILEEASSKIGALGQILEG